MARKAHKSPQCLNCGTYLRGRYCHECGQENLDHQESALHLVRHFFEDITHYDGKLLKTAKPLLVKPGFLTMEYLYGRRVSYLNPIRMFIFLNFLFFLIWFSLPGDNDSNIGQEPAAISTKLSNGEKLNEVITDNSRIDSIARWQVGHAHVAIPMLTYHTVNGYDSAQNALPESQRDGYMMRRIQHRIITTNHEAKKNPEFFKDKFIESFKHNIPKLNFLFLIVCSCVLYLIYYRKRLLMVNHAMFSIHLASTFLLLSILMLVLFFIPHGGWIAFAVFLYGNYYFYRALRNVYQQPRAKTMVKFVIVNFFLALTMLIGIALTVLYSLIC